MLLTVLAVLATSGPASAHTASPVVPEVLRMSAPEIRPAAESGPIGPVTPVGRSSLLLAIVLGVLGFGVEGARRHPRRALVLALGLLLAIFAFENGLHSVHHGFDAKQHGECTIAAASANLSAVSGDGLLAAPLVLIGTAPAADAAPPP